MAASLKLVVSTSIVTIVAAWSMGCSNDDAGNATAAAHAKVEMKSSDSPEGSSYRAVSLVGDNVANAMRQAWKAQQQYLTAKGEYAGDLRETTFLPPTNIPHDFSVQSLNPLVLRAVARAGTVESCSEDDIWTRDSTGIHAGICAALTSPPRENG